MEKKAFLNEWMEKADHSIEELKSEISSLKNEIKSIKEENIYEFHTENKDMLLVFLLSLFAIITVGFLIYLCLIS